MSSLSQQTLADLAATMRASAALQREINVMGANKIDRYDWKIKGDPGILTTIHKDVLLVNSAYQRQAKSGKVLNLARDWSWVACGALVVTRRDGEYWVIDGQHRLLAAQSRSDITHLPCVLFDLSDIELEARGFLDLNANRKPITAVEKQNALVVAGDEIAVFVHDEIARNGLDVSGSTKAAGTIHAVGWCIKHAREDREAFIVVLRLAAELSAKDRAPVRERLLDGLSYIHEKVEGGLFEKRLNKRIRDKGANVLYQAANKGAAYHGSGGAKVYGEGMLTELNRGMVNKFEVVA